MNQGIIRRVTQQTKDVKTSVDVNCFSFLILIAIAIVIAIIIIIVIASALAAADRERRKNEFCYVACRSTTEPLDWTVPKELQHIKYGGNLWGVIHTHGIYLSVHFPRTDLWAQSTVRREKLSTENVRAPLRSTQARSTSTSSKHEAQARSNSQNNTDTIHTHTHTHPPDNLPDPIKIPKSQNPLNPLNPPTLNKNPDENKKKKKTAHIIRTVELPTRLRPTRLRVYDALRKLH